MLSFPKGLFLCAIVLQILSLVICDSYRVELTSNGPIVRGATIRFTAKLYYGEELASGSYDYYWRDNALPEHSRKIHSDFPVVYWDVKFDAGYPPGPYEIEVSVERMFILVPYVVTSLRQYFTVTDTLNGNVHLVQKNVTRDTKYIATGTALTSEIYLNEPDAAYISNATTVTTFWFIDCIYYGPTSDRKFSHTFHVSGEEHSIDGLMLADFTPLPPPTTTTTTPKPTTSITTTVKPSTTTTKPPSSVTTQKIPITTKTNLPLNISTPRIPPLNLTSKILHRRSLNQSNNSDTKLVQKLKMNVNGTLVPYNASFPYVCNGTVSVDRKKVYGYFSKKFIAKAPISSVNVTGNNWLQHGDMLTLNVLCDGAPSLRYCVQFVKGSYNTTGNETCTIYLSLQTCSFLVQRYLGQPVEHTVVIILENDVTKVVKSVAITVYKVKKQAQLSVIVVPVAFCLVAVVLIVFGVAYYIQNRRRFLVEVADFNFGVDYSDMEYKTFRERLQESFANAFTRAPTPEPSEAPNWSLNQSQKYGSMT